MNSKTSIVAANFRLREWADQIRECQNRPAGMSVVGWCACHGITKGNYYYRLRRVREACLEINEGKISGQRIAPVPPVLLQQELKNSSAQAGLDISAKGFSVHVAESTPMPLLSAVLKVIRNAE